MCEVALEMTSHKLNRKLVSVGLAETLRKCSSRYPEQKSERVEQIPMTSYCMMGPRGTRLFLLFTLYHEIGVELPLQGNADLLLTRLFLLK